MPAARRLLIKKNGTVIAGVRQKSISIAGEPIDITDDQSSGWRTLDSDVGRRSVDISIEGFVTEADSTLRDALLAASPSLLLTDITVTFPNGDSLAGDFFLSSLEESGPENEANGFSAELQSSGTMNFTPAP